MNENYTEKLFRSLQYIKTKYIRKTKVKLVLINHTNLTKTAYGLSEGWKELSAMNSGSKSPIVVIGSSPTALTYLIDILENAKDLPSLIIGMPVGFIGVEKSKNKLSYLYIITPKGFVQKTNLTIKFMKKKMQEYDELKKEMENLKKKDVDNN